MSRLPMAGALLSGLLSPADAQCPPQHIPSPDGSSAGVFSWGMGATDRWLAVGDQRSDFFGADRGAVHIFERIDVTGPWAPVARLLHPEVPVGHGFGWRVAIDGDSLMASCGGADGLPFGSGVVYEYRLREGVWEFNERIDPPEPREEGYFGATIALHGRSVAIADQVFPGTVWLFEDRGSGWEVVAKVISPDPAIIDREFGEALALNDSWLMVGAAYDQEFALKSGAVYAYSRDAGGVELVQKLTSAGREISDFFGDSIAVDDGLMVAGCPGEDDMTRGQGAAYVFELHEGLWTSAAVLFHENPSGADALGALAALRGDTIVASATQQVPSPLVGKGFVYAFQRAPSGEWRQIARIAPEPDQWDNGRTLALSGSQAIVGSPRFSDGGSVTVHDLDCLTICRADLDGDGALTLFDFLAFQNLFAAGDLRADFDGSGALDFFDFLTFQNEFDAGCA